MAPPLTRRAPVAGALLLFWAGLCGPPAQAFGPAPAEEPARVATVLDGDTVVLADGRHVRLLGINSPERARDERPEEPLAGEATALLRRLVEGRRVRLQPGPETHDRYGRLLARLILVGGGDIQEILLEKGLASVIAIPPNLDHLGAYLDAERRARSAGRGIWSHPYFAPVRAGELDDSHLGYHFIQGRIQRVGKSRKHIYFDLTRNVSLGVSQEEWSRYWEGHPEDWLDATVQARGWLYRHGRKIRMRVRHPSMLRRLGTGADTVPNY